MFSRDCHEELIIPLPVELNPHLWEIGFFMNRVNQYIRFIPEFMYNFKFIPLPLMNVDTTLAITSSN
jgi:hypothetical protein